MCSLGFWPKSEFGFLEYLDSLCVSFYLDFILSPIFNSILFNLIFSLSLTHTTWNTQIQAHLIQSTCILCDTRQHTQVVGNYSYFLCHSEILLLLLLSHFSRVRVCTTHRQQPTRLCRPWDSPGKNTGVGCHWFLRKNNANSF